MSNFMDHHQQFWKGLKGDEYTRKNLNFTNTQYKEFTRLEIIRQFFTDINRDLSIIELGCNRGNFIQVLLNMGFSNITGVDINEEAIRLARKRFAKLDFIRTSIENFDYYDKYDMVVTCGVLIHINPDNIPDVINRIKDMSKKYIFGCEYYSKDFTVVEHSSKCYTGDYGNLFGIRPCKIEIHNMVREARAPNHVFYLIMK